MIKLNITALLTVCCMLCTGTNHQDKLEAVRSGKLSTAKAEWWGYNPTDSTKNLQKALASGVKKLIISKQANPWFVSKTLILPSNIEIVFEDGAEIKAVKNCFKGITDSLMKARGRQNITLRGKGIITMRKADYENPELYKKGEHRHTLGLFSCKNIKIKDLTLQKSGGDGIYVNKVDNILIDKVTLNDHYRQGISVISSENLLIKDCLIKNTKGTAPECGIDFEPNRADEKLINCRVVNCHFEDNATSAININCTRLVSKNKQLDILIKDCLFKGGKYGVSFLQMQRKGKASTVKGRIHYKNCRIESPSFSAMHIDTIRSTGPETVFENLNVSQPRSHVAPIYFYIRKFMNENCGNFKFINCIFSAPKATNILDCVNYSSAALKKIEGNVTFNGASVNLPQVVKSLGFNQKYPSMTLKEVNAAKLIPAGFTKETSPNICNFSLRGKFDIALYAAKGNEISIEVEYYRLGRYRTHPLVLTLIQPDGKKHQLGKLKYKSNTIQKFSFVPKLNGTYVLKIPKHINCIAIKKITAPWSVFCRKKSGLYNLLAPHGKIYFAIPAKVNTFWLELVGSGGRMTVDAKLKLDGKVIAQGTNISRSKYFQINLTESAKPRLAELSVKAKGGCSIILPAPLLPVFSNSPENVFVEK